MNTHQISRLPVLDENGKLVGIVGRRDLLSVFLRPDADVAHDGRSWTSSRSPIPRRSSRRSGTAW